MLNHLRYAKLMPRFTLFSASLLLTMAGVRPASAVIPESGIYWAPGGAGTGFILERQGNIVAFQIYTVDPDTKAPIFYVGAGEIRDDANGLPDQIPPYAEGYFPLHWVRAELASVSRNESDELVTHPFGRADIYFPSMRSLHVHLFAEDGSAIRYLPDRLRRFNFGFEWLGPHPYGGHGTSTLIDISGEWVFVDRSNLTAQPMRFQFERTRYDAVPGQEFIFTVTYEDASQDALVECRSNPHLAGSPDARPGCELEVAGEVVLSFNIDDYGIDRIEAFAGDLPPLLVEPLRREHRYTGIRLQDPPSGP